MTIRCEHGVSMFDADDYCGHCDLAEGRRQERADVVAFIDAECDEWCGQDSGDRTHWDVLSCLLSRINRGEHVGAASKEKKP